MDNKTRKIGILAFVFALVAITIAVSVPPGQNGTNGSSLIGSSLTFFLHDDTDSTVSFASKEMRRTFDPAEPIEFVNHTNLGNGDTLLQNWTSPSMGLVLIPRGVHSLHLHALKIGGGGARVVRIFYKCGIVNSTGGNLSIRGISELSEPITATLPYTEFDLEMLMEDQNINTTDKMLVEVWANQTGSGALPEIQLQFDDLTDSRLTFPTTQIDLTALVNNVSYLQDNVTLLQNNKVNKSGDNLTGSLRFVNNNLGFLSENSLSDVIFFDDGADSYVAFNANNMEGTNFTSMTISADAESTEFNVDTYDGINSSTFDMFPDHTNIDTKLMTINSMPVGYTLQVQGSSSNPADGQTYYFDSFPLQWTNTVDDVLRLYIPETGTIDKIYLTWAAAGVAGSNEALTPNIRHNSVDYPIDTISSTDAVKYFINTSVNVPVNAGDSIQIKLVTPTWGTNPTGVSWSGTIFIRL